MFLNPLMLAGIGGAVLPLVLHLIHKAKFRTVDWPAMLFLVGAQPRRRHRHKIRQWILLAIRMALVSLLAIALARPMVSDAFASLATGGHLAAAIVVDGSASTALVETGQSRTSLIKQTAMRIVASLRKGDQAVAINASDTGLRNRPQLSSDLQRVTDDIASIQPGGRANIAEALARAWDVLDAPGAGDRRLFVVCDRQAVSWREADAAFRSAWRERLARKPLSVPLTIIPLGGTTAGNVAITGVRLVDPPVIRDRPALVQATVHAFGPARQDGIIVKFSAGGKELVRTTVDCPANGEVTADASVRLPESGPQLLTAAIEPRGDSKALGLPGDNAMDLSLDVSDGIKVLLLDSDPTPATSATARLFVTTALRPFAAAGGGGADAFTLAEVPVERVTDTDIRAADVVMMVNVTTVSPAIIDAVEQFVYDGGGLLIAPGPLTRAGDWNDRLYHDGSGWLPAQFAPPGVTTKPASIASIDATHPLWKFQRGQLELPDVHVARPWGLSPLRSGARAIATLTGNVPACVDLTLGRGHVLQLAMPLDADGSDWPRQNSFVPFLQSSIAWLAGGGGGERNVAIGLPLAYAWSGDDVQSASIDPPSGPSVPLDIQRQGERSSIRYAQTDQPGVYKLQLTRTGDGPKTIPFVVRRDSDESDLTPFRELDWAALGKDLQATVVKKDADILTAALTRPAGGREIWTWLVLATIALAMAELFFAGRWMTASAAAPLANAALEPVGASL